MVRQLLVYCNMEEDYPSREEVIREFDVGDDHRRRELFINCLLLLEGLIEEQEELVHQVLKEAYTINYN